MQICKIGGLTTFFESDLAMPFDGVRNTGFDGKDKVDEARMSVVSCVLVYVLSQKEKLITLFK